MEKYFICSEEQSTKDEKKKYFHRVGELLKFETKDGGTFYKVKSYLMPEKQLSVFKDEPRKDQAGGAKAENAPAAPMPEDNDLPF